MPVPAEPVRTVRLAYELRIQASAQRTFEVMTRQSLDWFPHTYGGDRVQAVVLEPRVGGRHYEDWGGEQGHLYGHVTLFDPPRAWGRLDGKFERVRHDVLRVLSANLRGVDERELNFRTRSAAGMLNWLALAPIGAELATWPGEELEPWLVSVVAGALTGPRMRADQG